MTVIAWDGTTLAADKQFTNHGLPIAGRKIAKTSGGELLFSSGKASVCASMFAWYENGAKAEDWPEHQKKKDEAGWLYVIKKDKSLWCYETTPIPFQLETGKHACGCGRDYALAAMYMGADAVKAVEVAIHFDNECGMGIDTLTLDE